MLLLISAVFIQRLDHKKHPKWTTVAGITLPLVMLCLTRSMYHLVWLLGLAIIFLVPLRRTPAFRPLLTGFLLATVIVGSWYVKNYLIFHQFSTSTWIGMNMARTVFHDAPVKDSTRIEAYEPFSGLETYRPFISDSAIKKYAGLDDRDLLAPKKSDSSSFNLNAVAYIQVSRQYMTASENFIKTHPGRYLANVAQSALLFFAPATRYPFSEIEAPKIKYYDLLYSFNLTHFATSKGSKRVLVALSALPKLLLYLAVLYIFLRNALKEKNISLLSLFALAAIGYVFTLSSLLEHYENMRFRYEVEPLFLLLLGQTIALLMDRRKKQYLKLKNR
jgi:4-amino-4-deoxy-L-arabinose transferase-like glycosyltransferase